MANLIDRFSRSAQSAAARQPTEQESEFMVALNNAIEGVARLNDRVDELFVSLNEQKQMLEDIAKSIKEMTEVNTVQTIDTLSESDAYLDTQLQQNESLQQQYQNVELLVSPIQKTTGILLVVRESTEDAKAQFVLDEKTGQLSFNPASFSFCVYDVEARLMPFADVVFDIKDKKANDIEQIEAGKAEKKDGNWYCTIKPKLKIV